MQLRFWACILFYLRNRDAKFWLLNSWKKKWRARNLSFSRALKNIFQQLRELSSFFVLYSLAVFLRMCRFFIQEPWINRLLLLPIYTPTSTSSFQREIWDENKREREMESKKWVSEKYPFSENQRDVYRLSVRFFSFQMCTYMHTYGNNVRRKASWISDIPSRKNFWRY